MVSRVGSPAANDVTWITLHVIRQISCQTADIVLLPSW